MRIQYTLPGMQPAGFGGETVVTDPGQSFKGRLRRLTSTAPTNWRQVLRLDQQRNTALTIGPPPRPVNLELKDAASERVRWRNLISRDIPGSDSDPGVGRMVGLLRGFQEMEDSVVARTLSETRG
jgi:hypothetical protein